MFYINFRAKKTIISIFSVFLIFAILFTVNSFCEQSSDPESYIELPIIMYHGILKDKKLQGKYVISPNDFEDDLKYINDNGFTTIFMDDLINYVYNDIALPEKPIMLTFDDGYYNNYVYAFPLVQQYSCKMVLSPIIIETDKFSKEESISPIYGHCSWDNLKEMQDSGFVEIQNHTYNLHKRSKMRIGAKKCNNESFDHYKGALSTDILKAQDEISSHLSITPTTFVYPFGSYSKCSTDILKDLGFKASISCEERINKITKDPNRLFCLYRFLRPNGIKSEKYFQKVLSK